MTKRTLLFIATLLVIHSISGCGGKKGGVQVELNEISSQLTGRWFAQTPNEDGDIIVLNFESAEEGASVRVEAIRPMGDRISVDEGTFEVTGSKLKFRFPRLGSLDLPYALATQPQAKLTIGGEIYLKVSATGPTLAGQIRITQLKADEFVTVSSIVPPHVPGEILVRRKGGSVSGLGLKEGASSRWTKVRLPEPASQALTLTGEVDVGAKVSSLHADRARVSQGEKEFLADCRKKGWECTYNILLRMQGMPDDPHWEDQWNLRLLNMASVFEIEDEVEPEAEEVVVAVVDTGIVPEHPDIAPLLLKRPDGRPWGHDFVVQQLRDPTTNQVVDERFSLDGDGEEDNPKDEGDQDDQGIPGTISSWHGTHLAGIIASLRNNGEGIAGMTSRVKIMPVRAIGRGGDGRIEDVAEAVRYACRLPNIGDCENPEDTATCDFTFSHNGIRKNRPQANVINMSLGVATTVEQASVLLDAIHDCLREAEERVVFVAAAGNYGLGPGHCYDIETGRFVANASCKFYPASDESVLSVGAITGSGAFAESYSNFGPRQFVVAPGGSASQPVLSSVHPNAVDGYWGLMGTSQSAAHVSGLAGMLMAYKEDLDLQGVWRLIRDTAIYLGNEGGSRANRWDPNLGYGLINPYGALLGALGRMPEGKPALETSVNGLDFASHGETATLVLYNTGGGELDLLEFPVTTDDGGDWLQVEKKALNQGTAPWALVIRVDRSGVTDGDYSGSVTIRTNGGEKVITVAMTVSSLSTGGADPVENLIRRATNLLNGTGEYENNINVGDFYIYAISDETEKMYYVRTNLDANYNFYMMLPAGKYRIIAGVDDNNDQTICTEQDSLCLGFPTFAQPTTIDCTNGCNPANIVISY